MIADYKGEKVLVDQGNHLPKVGKDEGRTRGVLGNPYWFCGRIGGDLRCNQSSNNFWSRARCENCPFQIHGRQRPSILNIILG
ncbi:hypothetical protein CR513_60901, partial [Mucuna pruriens]